MDWPCITPFNVWDLTLGDWLGYADAHDRLADQRKRAEKG